MDAEVAKVQGEIDADKTLDAATKAKQKQAAADAGAAAKTNIDNATDAQGVKDALGKGIKAVDDTHVTGALLDTQKQDAKDAIDAEVAKVQGEIDADKTLDAA
ncbi:DUF1542 domain-containing protein, partial [Lactobacillus sp. M0390]|nr:DUF1542 domain-containing protein [Lactobacillus sp. M0390]